MADSPSCARSSNACRSARFAFLGDTARLPYGSKSRRTIARYAAQSAQFLVREQGAEFLVIACNTASALALDAIQEAVTVPVLGVIEPGAAAARAASRTGDVLVIATEATVQSHAYAAACQARGLRAIEKACPLLVPLVEEGWTDHPITAEVIEIYLNELRAEAAAQGMNPDTLVLGCTHYPLLRPLIERAVRPGRTVIDSAESAAKAAAELFNGRTHGSAPGGPPGRPTEIRCFATDSVEKFERLGSRFLGRPVGMWSWSTSAAEKRAPPQDVMLSAAGRVIRDPRSRGTCICLSSLAPLLPVSERVGRRIHSLYGPGIRRKSLWYSEKWRGSAVFPFEPELRRNQHSMINLAGKTAVVFGLANKRSIAWGIAQKLHEAGATLAICYQNERMKAEAEDLINDLPGASGFQCDVSNDQEIAALFAALKEKYGKIHILVHAIAYAPAEDLKGEFINTSREGFRIAHDVSVYSLIAVARGAVPLMTEGGSIITLTYYAAEKVVPHYNVMALAKASLESAVRYLAFELGPKNIRVNAISAGPIKTLAARGVGALGEMLKSHAERAPLHRNVDQLEVGGTALYLASDLASAVTGETLYVDCGYNIMGY